eukprot:COSAG06_NODE_1547_length_9132_cov_3.139046_4_plen_411_part_00
MVPDGHYAAAESSKNPLGASGASESLRAKPPQTAADNVFRKVGIAVLGLVSALAVFLFVSPQSPAELSASTADCASDQAPVLVKTVVVAFFDGEAQLWLERGIGGQLFDQRLPFPAGYRCSACEGRFGAPDSSPAQLYISSSSDVVLVVTGVGTASAASTIMALGHDSRLDLRSSYWVLAGIAGIDPLAGSIGSGAWAEWVVDATHGHFVDPREMPAHWQHGHWPSAHGAHGTKATEAAPYPDDKAGLPPPDSVLTSFRAASADTVERHGGLHARRLDTGLVQWAYDLTKDIELQDSEVLRATRAGYVNYPNALRPPFVLLGDNLDGQTYWVGLLQTEWARDWVDWHTGGAGTFVTSAMEDTGVLRAMESLGAELTQGLFPSTFYTKIDHFAKTGSGRTYHFAKTGSGQP